MLPSRLCSNQDNQAAKANFMYFYFYFWLSTALGGKWQGLQKTSKYVLCHIPCRVMDLPTPLLWAEELHADKQLLFSLLSFTTQIVLLAVTLYVLFFIPNKRVYLMLQPSDKSLYVNKHCSNKCRGQCPSDINGHDNRTC